MDLDLSGKTVIATGSTGGICYLCSRASSVTNGAAFRAHGGIVTNPF